MHLRTPWDKQSLDSYLAKPTTEAVVDLEINMSQPNHPEIPVTEVKVYNRISGKSAFKISFINMTRVELMKPIDEFGMTELDRALWRRGLTDHFYVDPSTIKSNPQYSTPRRLTNAY